MITEPNRFKFDGEFDPGEPAEPKDPVFTDPTWEPSPREDIDPSAPPQPRPKPEFPL